MSKTVTLNGFLSIREWGEGEYETLFCGDTIVAEWAMKKINRGCALEREYWTPGYYFSAEQCERKEMESKRNRWVSVRYWIADRKGSADEIKRAALERLYGAVDVDFGAEYSEITGYLWTEEKFKVGGHDMIARLSSEVGSYLLLEIDIHDKPLPQSASPSAEAKPLP